MKRHDDPEQFAIMISRCGACGTLLAAAVGPDDQCPHCKVVTKVRTRVLLMATSRDETPVSPIRMAWRGNNTLQSVIE